MSNSNYTDEYYKVSFVTTHSKSMPSMLKYTGSLIVMSDLSTKDPTTNKNGMSIWLRGEHIASGWGLSSSYRADNATWLADSYNRIFGPDDTKGAEEFDPESSINKNIFKDSPTYTEAKDGALAKKPISLYNRFEFTYNHIEETKKNLFDKIDENNKSQSGVNNEIKNQINEVDKKHTDKENELDKKIDDTKESCYTYTTYNIEKLIGNAPGTLDTLGEIANWLNHARSLGMDTIDAIVNIKNSYLTHEAPDANNYTYLSEYTSHIKKDEENPRTGNVYTYDKETGEWIETSETYTYYDYVVDETYTNAIRSTQISTPFEEHQLSEILKRIITAYPYATPTITIKSIDNIDVEAWQEEIVPVGTKITDMKCICNIDLNDSSELTNIVINNISNQIRNCTYNVNKPDVEYTLSAGEFTSTIPGTFTIFQYSTNDYGGAIHQEYPQLVGIDGTPVYDEDHKYEAGTETKELANKEITKTFKYAFYVKTTEGMDDLISDAAKIKEYGTLCYADGNEKEGICKTSVLNANKDAIRCTLLLPTSILSNTNTKIYITDVNTHIKELIYAEGKLNQAFTSDIMGTATTKLDNTWLQQEYSYVTIFTYRYPFANSFTFDVEW